MNVAIVTSVSSGNAGIAALTTPNKLEYCLRHGYSLVADNQPYEQAVANMRTINHYLDRFDLVWTLDADAVITNMTVRIDELPCLGPNATVCEEGIVDWNWINCGSMVWKNTEATRHLLEAVDAAEPVWRHLVCITQTWIGEVARRRPEFVTVAPLRSFNSCEWNRPGNAEGEPGTHWQPGDFVYHPCGVYPLDERQSRLARAMQQVIR